MEPVGGRGEVDPDVPTGPLGPAGSSNGSLLSPWRKSTVTVASCANKARLRRDVALLQVRKVHPKPLFRFPHPNRSERQRERTRLFVCLLGMKLHWEAAMDKSVREARWLLIPLFGLWGLVALVGVVFG